MMSSQYDVIVIGGGIVGAATAYQLAQTGKKILLLDQFEPGHTRGSSHGDGRVVRFNYTEAIYVEMAVLAYKAWEALGQEAGQPLFQKTGLIEYGPADCEAINISESNLKQYKIAYERLPVTEGSARFPQFHFASGSDVLYQPEGAIAFATPAVKALWRLSSERGVSTQTGQRVAAIEPETNQVRVRSATGEIWLAQHVVIATGGWAQQMLATLNLQIPLEVTQELLAYFPPKDETNHRIGAMPVMIDYHDAEAPYYCLPQVEVGGVKTGWHHSGNVVEPDKPQTTNAHVLKQMQAWVERVFPHLNKVPIETHNCLYTSTPDFHFVLDRHPVYQNVIIGAGFSGHGFKFGPVLGQLLAELVLEKEPSVGLDTFAIRRFDNPETLQKRIGA